MLQGSVGNRAPLLWKRLASRHAFLKNSSLQDLLTLSYLQAFALPMSFELRAMYLSPGPLPKVFLPL